MPRSLAPTEEKQSPAERLDEHARAFSELLIEQLGKGTSPWQKPWENSRTSLPINASTGKAYRGSNLMFLWVVGINEGYTDPRWMTFNQARDLKASVNKGEHGRKIMYAVTHYEVNKKDANGRPVIGADGQPEKLYVKYDSPRMKYYTVFNAAQVTGLPPLEPTVKHEWNQHARCENILSKSGAKIHHGGNQAYYAPILDAITLPHKTQFASADRYYATALHELGHWTGHPSRLDRDMSGGYGSESYAREELRAEISSLMVGSELDLGHDPGQHVAYVKHWVKILQDDPKEILRACTDASKIQEHVLGFEKTVEIEHVHENIAEQRKVQTLASSTSEAIEKSEEKVHFTDLKSERAEYDAKTGAYVQHANSGRMISTFGNEHPTLTIATPGTQSRVSVQLNSRDDAWRDLTYAIQNGTSFDSKLPGRAIDARGERPTVMHVVVGRRHDGLTSIAIRPTDRQHDDSYIVRLTAPTAYRLGRAMDQSQDLARKAFVVQSLTTSLEATQQHEISR